MCWFETILSSLCVRKEHKLKVNTHEPNIYMCALKWYTDKAQPSTWKTHHVHNINTKVIFVLKHNISSTSKTQWRCVNANLLGICSWNFVYSLTSWHDKNSSQSRHRLFTRYSLNLAKRCARWSVTALVSVLLSLLLLLLQFSLFPLSIYLSILILLPEAMCVSEWVCASITSLSVITDDAAQIRNTKFGPQLEKHLGWVPYFFLCVCVCVAVVVVVTFN